MDENCKNWPIEASTNISVIDKLPRDAPRGAWRKFHQQWNREQQTPHQLASSVWRGHSFAPCFNGRKVKADFDLSWHIALDFDCADERASIDTLIADDFIYWYSSFLYYTPSSNPPAYKSRVVFVLQEPITDADKYEEVLDAFAWKYPDSDQSTSDAARFFFGSKGCTVHGNWSILTPGAIEWLVDEWRKEIPPNPPPPPFNPGNVDESKIAEALKHIPPRMDYSDWVTVLMGVHSVLPNGRGVQLIESWSPGYDGEIDNKFNSFKRANGDGVTIRTVYRMAIDNGWRPKVNGGGSGHKANRYDLRGKI